MSAHDDIRRYEARFDSRIHQPNAEDRRHFEEGERLLRAECFAAELAYRAERAARACPPPQNRGGIQR